MSHIFLRNLEETLDFSFLSTFGELIFIALHQMYQGKTEESEYFAWGSTQPFAFLFMYRNTQFPTKTQSIFRMRKVDSSLLVLLHWSIQNSSCTVDVPMFIVAVSIIIFSGSGGSCSGSGSSSSSSSSSSTSSRAAAVVMIHNS